ncbi:hypothetical protein Hte_003511 [Hypoxylon texense]
MATPLHLSWSNRTLEKDLAAVNRAAHEARASRRSLAEQNLGFEIPKFSGGGLKPVPKPIPVNLDDTEYSSRIPVESSRVLAFTSDIINIKTLPATEIADGGKVTTSEKSGRVLEAFSLRGYSVVKLTISDADVRADGDRRFGNLAVCREYEQEITDKMGRGQPPLDVEQWVAANLILAAGDDTDDDDDDDDDTDSDGSGDIRGRSPGGFWAGARDKARLRLSQYPGLEGFARRYMAANPDRVLKIADPSLYQVLSAVREFVTTPVFNPYHQLERDHLARVEKIYEHVDSDVFITLDKNGQVIAFAIKDAFDDLVGPQARMRITQAIDTYTSLHPVPNPDPNQDRLHHASWLRLQRPDLQVPPEAAPKSGTYTIGMVSATTSPNDLAEPCEVLDIAHRGSTTDQEQLRHVRLSVLGTCTAVVDYYLEILDPDLRRQYVRATDAVSKHHSRGKELCFRTRPDDDPFALRSVGINTKRCEQDHDDSSQYDRPWEGGLGAFAALGDFEGGDLLLRELGVAVACPPGSVQILRSELRHSTVPYTGKRFEVAHQTPEGVRRWAERNMSEQEKRSWGEGADTGDVDRFFSNLKLFANEPADAGMPAQAAAAAAAAAAAWPQQQGYEDDDEDDDHRFGTASNRPVSEAGSAWPTNGDEDQQLVFPPNFIHPRAAFDPNYEAGAGFGNGLEWHHSSEDADGLFKKERRDWGINKWRAKCDPNPSDPNIPLEN